VGALLILFIVFMVVVGPILTLISLNLLFDLSIPLNFDTWFCAMWLSIVVAGGVKATFK
jgi:hypothetical protein